MFQMQYPKAKSYFVNLELYMRDLEQALLDDVSLVAASRAAVFFEKAIQCHFLLNDLCVNAIAYDELAKKHREEFIKLSNRGRKLYEKCERLVAPLMYAGYERKGSK